MSIDLGRRPSTPSTRRVTADPRARRGETPPARGERSASRVTTPASRSHARRPVAPAGRVPHESRRDRGRARPAAPSRHNRPLQKRVAKQQRPSGLVLTFRAGDPRKRLVAVFVISMLLFAAVVARVAFLQTAGADSLVAAGRAQRVSESRLHAQRGTIFARDGGELVLSVPSSTIFANPKLVTDPTGESAVLASLLGLSPAKQQSLLEAFTAKDKSFVYVARQIDDELGASVMALNLAGIDLLHEDKRIMPSGEVGRSLLGRTDIDGIGTAGLELQYNAELTGKDGERVREHDAKGRSIPGSGATTTEPVPGKDLVLTIDRSLQFQVEQALIQRVITLKAKGGAVVVMDTKTGDIYAIANVKLNDDGSVTVTSANMAAVDTFEPGSVAKVFSLSAVVDTGTAGPDTTINVPGKMTFGQGTQWEQTITDAELHNEEPMTLRDIIVHSSNIGTLKLAQQMGTSKVGEYLSAFGFGTKTALNFPDESAGRMKPDEWQGTQKVTTSYGYGYSVTAVQLTAAVNTVANGGVYVAPRLLAATIGADGTIVDSPAAASHQVLQPATAATMTDLMQGVVCEGTGTGAKIDGISVAGKTGTAYKTQGKIGYGDNTNRAYRATFVGYFPAQAPRVTILTTIDEPDPTSNDRFGGTAAAPLFSQIATAAIHELQITPTPGDTGCPAAG